MRLAIPGLATILLCRQTLVTPTETVLIIFAATMSFAILASVIQLWVILRIPAAIIRVMRAKPVTRELVIRWRFGSRSEFIRDFSLNAITIRE